MHFNAREPLSALIQCLRAFCNGLLRFTRNDGLFTTHYSRLTKAAFTLAETLIVIGIIGVVAALTLPNLNHATGDKETVTRVKKIYSSLTDAADRAQAIYGPADAWYKNEAGSNRVAYAEIFGRRLSEFMKISKDCGMNGEGCFSHSPLLGIDAEKYSSATDDYLKNLSDYTYMVLLADGMSIGFNGDSIIRVDIDGPQKGKNQIGKDIFTFDFCHWNKNSEFAEVTPDQDFWSKANDEDLGSPCNNYATIWVVRYDNVDYLKCPEELDFAGNHSCK